MKKKNEDGFLQVDVKPLIDWQEPNGAGCIVSDMISKPDSGWHFFKGDESDAYSSDAGNFHVFALNTVCNYDPDIIPYLHLPVGTHLIRTEDGKFMEDDGAAAIKFERQ